MILLDEATSALDRKNEIQIEETLNEICRGKLSIRIAHRVSTIMDSELIMVIGNGRIIQKGRFKDLERFKVEKVDRNVNNKNNENKFEIQQFYDLDKYKNNLAIK